MNPNDVSTFPLLPITDVIQGSLYDDEGVTYVLFIRSRPSALVTLPRIMTQDTKGRVLQVILVKSIQEQAMIITLKSQNGTLFSCNLANAHDAYENSILNTFTMVALANELPAVSRDYMPNDYWQTLISKT